MTATKTYSDAEIEQILRENAQMRRWLAEYQKAAREQRKASERRYAQRKREGLWARARSAYRRLAGQINTAINEVPVSVAVVVSLMIGAFAAFTVIMMVLEVHNYETMLWVRGLK